MPTYVYGCPTCGRKFERVKPIRDIDSVESCPHDGFSMNRLICAPAVRPDYAGYDCPVTGKRIEGRVAHEENLRRTGCRVLEDGERENAARTRRQAEDSLLHEVGEGVEQAIHSMPTRKREQLIAEIDSGADVSVIRQSPASAE